MAPTFIRAYSPFGRLSLPDATLAEQRALGERATLRRVARDELVIREGDAPDLERDFLDDLNPNSKQTIVAQLEPSLRDAKAEERFQFERHGYFVADRVDSRPGAPVFNRAVTLKDSWGKAG